MTRFLSGSYKFKFRTSSSFTHKSISVFFLRIKSQYKGNLRPYVTGKLVFYHYECNKNFSAVPKICDLFPADPMFKIPESW